MITSVNAWIVAGKPFKEGVILLAILCPDHKKLTVIRSARSSFTEQLLDQALMSLDQPSSQVRVSATRQPIPLKTASSVPVDRPLPAELVQLQQNWKRAYKEAVDLRYQLKGITSGRKKMYRDIAFQILEKMDYVHSCWKTIDQFKSTGQLPSAQPDPDDLSGKSLMELMQGLKNIPTYITKAKKELAATRDATVIERKTVLIDRHTKSLAAYKKRIRAIDEKIANGTV